MVRAQCVAVCYCVLLFVVVCLQGRAPWYEHSVLQCFAVCCSLMQSVHKEGHLGTSTVCFFALQCACKEGHQGSITPTELAGKLQMRMDR